MGKFLLKNISKSFSTTKGINNLNLEIEDGEFLTLVVAFIIAQKKFTENITMTGMK